LQHTAKNLYFYGRPIVIYTHADEDVEKNWKIFKRTREQRVFLPTSLPQPIFSNVFHIFDIFNVFDVFDIFDVFVICVFQCFYVFDYFLVFALW